MMYRMFRIFAFNLAMVAAQTGVVFSSPQELTFGVYSETVAGCVLCGQPGASCCAGTYGSSLVLFRDSLQAPEGVENIRAEMEVSSEGWAGWFIQWGAEWDEEVVLDMRSYVHGQVRFLIKTPVDLRIGIRSMNVLPGEERSLVWVSDYSEIDDQWHDVSVPIRILMAQDPLLDLASMKILFNVACVQNTGGMASFSVDHVRWITADETTPYVSEVRPDRSLNIGSVLDTIQGWGFEDGALARLMCDGAVVEGTHTTWLSSEVLTTMFGVAGAAEADWDVVVTNPGGQSDTLEGGFTIRFFKPPSVGPVTTAGRQVFVNESQFIIKGVGYAPTPIGKDPSWPIPDYGSPDTLIYPRDFALLQQMGCNTIRTWGKISQTLLDAADAHGLMAICGFWVHTDLDLGNVQARNSVISDFRLYVQTYKDSPAVLMWSVGNEQNYQNGDNPEWYRLVNEMAWAAYEEEGPVYHPVTTPNGDIYNIGDPFMEADDISMNYLDAWGANVYRGISFGTLFDDFAGKSGRPFWISEYGIDAWDHGRGREYPETQAAYVTALWNEIEQNADRCSGGTIMAYSDEWWKNGDPHAHDPGGYQTPYHPDGWSDEEYYGIVSVEDNASGPDIMRPREVYGRLQDAWSSDIMRGDVDNDGITTVLDVVAVINHILGLAPLQGESFLAADCDADGQVNVLDALGIVRVILGTGTCATGSTQEENG